MADTKWNYDYTTSRPTPLNDRAGQGYTSYTNIGNYSPQTTQRQYNNNKSQTGSAGYRDRNPYYEFLSERDQKYWRDGQNRRKQFDTYYDKYLGNDPQYASNEKKWLAEYISFIESKWVPSAENKDTHAKGLFQIMPQYWGSRNYSNIQDQFLRYKEMMNANDKAIINLMKSPRCRHNSIALSRLTNGYDANALRAIAWFSGAGGMEAFLLKGQNRTDGGSTQSQYAAPIVARNLSKQKLNINTSDSENAFSSAFGEDKEDLEYTDYDYGDTEDGGYYDDYSSYDDYDDYTPPQDFDFSDYQAQTEGDYDSQEEEPYNPLQDIQMPSEARRQQQPEESPSELAFTDIDYDEMPSNFQEYLAQAEIRKKALQRKKQEEMLYNLYQPTQLQQYAQELLDSSQAEDFVNVFAEANPRAASSAFRDPALYQADVSRTFAPQQQQAGLGGHLFDDGGTQYNAWDNVTLNPEGNIMIEGVPYTIRALNKAQYPEGLEVIGTNKFKNFVGQALMNSILHYNAYNGKTYEDYGEGKDKAAQHMQEYAMTHTPEETEQYRRNTIIAGLALAQGNPYPAYGLDNMFANLLTGTLASTEQGAAEKIKEGNYLEGGLEAASPFLFNSGPIGNIARSVYGGYHLLNENGLQKTGRELLNGNYWNAAKSFAGDLGNALLTGVGAYGMTNDALNLAARLGNADAKSIQFARALKGDINSNIDIPYEFNPNIYDYWYTPSGYQWQPSSYAFYERPSKLSIAERFGLSKQARNSLTANEEQGLADLYDYMGHDQYRQSFKVDAQDNPFWGTITSEGTPFMRAAVERHFPQRGNIVRVSQQTDTGKGALSYNYDKNIAGYYSGMFPVDKSTGIQYGEARMTPDGDNYLNIVLTAPRTDASLGVDTPEILESIPNTIDKGIMKNFWISARNLQRPGTYLSGDSGSLPLGNNLITAFKNRQLYKANLEETPIEQQHITRIGLSPDSYSSIIRQGNRDGSLRWGNGFTTWNSSAVENKHIYDAFQKYMRGEITKEEYENIFNTWANSFGGQNLQWIKPVGASKEYPVHPHPYIYKGTPQTKNTTSISPEVSQTEREVASSEYTDWDTYGQLKGQKEFKGANETASYDGSDINVIGQLGPDDWDLNFFIPYNMQNIRTRLPNSEGQLILDNLKEGNQYRNGWSLIEERMKEPAKVYVSNEATTGIKGFRVGNTGESYVGLKDYIPVDIMKNTRRHEVVGHGTEDEIEQLAGHTARMEYSDLADELAQSGLKLNSKDSLDPEELRALMFQTRDNLMQAFRNNDIAFNGDKITQQDIDTFQRVINLLDSKQVIQAMTGFNSSYGADYAALLKAKPELLDKFKHLISYGLAIGAPVGVGYTMQNNAPSTNSNAHAYGGTIFGDGGTTTGPETIITPDEEYNQFLNTLPDNQRLTPNEDYDTYLYWKLNGKPKSFLEAVSKGMYNWDNSDKSYHGNSIAWGEDGIGYFMKPKHHDTLKYELDWFNKNIVTEEGGHQRFETPEERAESDNFRNNYVLAEDPTRPNFYIYAPINQAAGLHIYRRPNEIPIFPILQQ